MKNPSIREIEEYIRQKKGEYGAKRVQRAADEIPNLENLYTSEALKHAFGGDNAQAMMTMKPADFESYASPIPERTRHWPSNGESTPDKANLPTADYIHYLQSVGKFNDVPYLELNKEEAGLPLTPFISGHEGRHRSRAMAKAGQKQGLVRMIPRAELREPFPRRHQEDYIEAMKKELAMTNGLVLPQRYSESKDDGWTETPIRRPAIKLPDIYANGGIIHKAKAKGGSVMGINVASDRKAGRSYADMIVDGHKTFESRNSDTLRPYVGKRVAIVRTGEGKAKAIGEVTIGEPIVANKKQFRNLESHHLVPEGSTFDIKTETKHMYPLSDPVRYEQERDVGHGIVSRKVIEKAKGGKVDVRPTVSYSSGGITHKAIGGSMNTPSLAQMRVEIGRHSNPQVMGNIGVNEAVDIQPKIFVNPNPNSPGMPDVGGVKTPKGALPVGGIDQNLQQPGQQMMPQQPQQQAPSGLPGQAPTGPTPPMGNMLQMTKQGQALGAMQPPQQGMAKGGPIDVGQMRIDLNRAHHFAKGGAAKAPQASQRLLIKAHGPNGVQGIVVPRHMWEGKNYTTGQKVDGMQEINKARAEVYGSENRPPLNIGQINRIHKQTLVDHFQKPLNEQISDENEALDKLRSARHIHHNANTLDESEKLDTVRHETDNEGRTHVGFASKGVAGHSLYTSGHGKNETHHVVNTCPGQTEGCGGGVDQNGIVDTSKGTCFAPNAESQYVNASVRRACHEQAKHDPAMTRDWILAHTGSLRKAAKIADKNNQRLLFRPNVVDETDTSSRHVLRHLNEQRQAENKPSIIANSYGKTNELHDPENGYYVTHSNVGPKTKHGQSIAENIRRDNARVRNTIYAADNQGDFKNEQGNKTPPKNSYMVTNVKRGSPFDQEMQKTITHAKYWSKPREQNELTAMERDEGAESHYDGKGRPTTPQKAHYGHMTIEGRRYDYQKQHILHPRLVQVGTNDDGTPHMIPTDSRFQDNNFLPKNRFKTRNGKDAGAILMTTPTESTSNALHHTSFTHDVNPVSLEYAKRNNGQYEIDSPIAQELSRNKEYVPPQPIMMKKKTWARGGRVNGYQLEYNDEFNAFPEQDGMAQHHLSKRTEAQE